MGWLPSFSAAPALDPECPNSSRRLGDSSITPAQGRAGMDSCLIHGGTRLKGKIEISGSKNSALPIIAACLMAEGKSTLKGVPRLSDIDSMKKLIGELGCHVYRHESDHEGLDGGPALNGPLDITVTDERQCEARYD